MRSDKKGAVPAGSGTSVRLKVAAGEKVTYYTSDFPPITLSAPGVIAKVSLTVSLEGDIAGMAANNVRYFGLGLFNSNGTSPGNSFADDSGYLFTFKGSAIDSGFIELRKRLGNGKSPSLNPPSEARVNINSSKNIQAAGSIAANAPYKIVFQLARRANGIAFGEGRDSGSAGVFISGGGAAMAIYSSEADASPETTTFNEFGIFLENRSSTDAFVVIDSLQLELRKDGELIAETTKPTLVAQPADAIALVGSRVTFSSDATGGALTYQWLKNKVNIPGAVGKDYVIDEAKLDDAGLYSVVVSNPYGSIESSPASLQLKQMIALKPDTPPVEQLIFEEDSVDTKPEFRKMPRIRYPSTLKQRTISGTTVIRFVVTTEGYVDALQFVKYADRELIEPLMNSYQKARYKPGLKKGKPVCTRVTVTIPYETP
ncbi:MAG: energy transducer TonB [Nibricoccus sp.]